MTISETERKAITILLDCAQDLNLKIILVGAAARRLLLENIHKRPVGRATMDWDWGVLVQDWAVFEALRSNLLTNPQKGFRVTPLQHRLEYHGVGIDLVPFGPIAGDEHSIVWPESQQEMSVLGFDEALASVREVKLENIILPIVSIPALTLLKIISYNDDSSRRQRDLTDFLYILGNYSTVAEERMWAELPEKLSDGSLDFETAGPFLLGADVKEISGTASLQISRETARELHANSDRHLVPLQSLSLSEGDQRRQLHTWAAELEAFHQGLV